VLFFPDGVPLHIESCTSDQDDPDPTGGTCDPGNTSQAYAPSSPPHLKFIRTYYWSVRVKDDRPINPAWSDWAITQSFDTIDHKIYNPIFSVSPGNPTLGEEVEFVDTSQCFWTLNLSDPPTTVNRQVDCNNPAADSSWPGDPNPNRYEWDFNDDGIIDCDSNTEPARCRDDLSFGPLLYTFNSVGVGNKVLLRISDTDSHGDNFCELTKSFNVGIPFPDWEEISPF